jgi:hypothetical protein
MEWILKTRLHFEFENIKYVQTCFAKETFHSAAGLLIHSSSSQKSLQPSQFFFVPNFKLNLED